MVSTRDPEDQALVDRQREIVEDAEWDIARAKEAQSLLENPILIRALETIESTWNEAWRNTAPIDREKREAAYQMLYMLQEFRTELRNVIEHGKIAAKTTDAIRGVSIGSSGEFEPGTE